RDSGRFASSGMTTYSLRPAWFSRGRGRLSRSCWAGAISSSSIISSQRSMHSSHMYPPGPAMSFLTCRWLLPQKLQRSCSLPSLARAIQSPWSPFTPKSPCALGRRGSPRGLTALHDSVDDAVLLGLLRRHVVVAIHVLLHLVDGLSRMVRHDLFHQPLEADHRACLNVDVSRLPVEAGRPLVDQDL